MKITYDQKIKIKNLSELISSECKNKECDVMFILDLINRLHHAGKEVSQNEAETNK